MHISSISKWIPFGVMYVFLHSIYGGGMATPFSVTYGTEILPVSSAAELAGAASTFDYVNGDGVVPSISAAAGENTGRPVSQPLPKQSLAALYFCLRMCILYSDALHVKERIDNALIIFRRTKFWSLALFCRRIIGY